MPFVKILIGTVFWAGNASKLRPLKSSSLSVMKSKSESWAEENLKEKFKLLID